MIVIVETNFVLEVAYLQEEHVHCGEIISLAEQGKIELALPAFSISEPYESWKRRAQRRSELHSKIIGELKEIGRSKPYRRFSVEFQELTKTLAESSGEE